VRDMDEREDMRGLGKEHKGTNGLAMAILHKRGPSMGADMESGDDDDDDVGEGVAKDMLEAISSGDSRALKESINAMVEMAMESRDRM